MPDAPPVMAATLVMMDALSAAFPIPHPASHKNAPGVTPGAGNCSAGLESRRPRSGGEIEAVEVHHLGPRRREVLHELLLRVGTGIDLGEGAQLRVRAEDQI